MVRRDWWRVCAALIAAAALAGCVPLGPRPVSGLITGIPGTPRSGAEAPDIAFRDSSGRSRSLSSFLGDATIVAFVEKPSSKEASPLAVASASLRGRVAVVEIIPPLGESKLSDEMGAKPVPRKSALIALFDPRSLATQALAARTQGTVLVLDRFGTVVAEGTMKDLDRRIEKAERVADEAERERSNLHWW